MNDYAQLTSVANTSSAKMYNNNKQMFPIFAANNKIQLWFIEAYLYESLGW